MSWSDERISELTRLWQTGHSASEIGKRLGVSKNAVVGKAHRLKLPSRPSPIKQQGLVASGQSTPKPRARASAVAKPSRVKQGQSPRPVAAGAERAEPAPQATAKPANPPRAGNGNARSDATANKAGGPAKARPRVAAARTGVEARSSSGGCLWPIGDPNDADFHFCGAQAVPGKPYCQEHASRAYITRSRAHASEEAA